MSDFLALAKLAAKFVGMAIVIAAAVYLTVFLVGYSLTQPLAQSICAIPGFCR